MFQIQIQLKLKWIVPRGQVLLPLFIETEAILNTRPLIDTSINSNDPGQGSVEGKMPNNKVDTGYDG